MADRRVLCTFTVGDLFLGLDIASVQEVLRGQEVTRLPLASAAVKGIINLRGRIVPALDLRRCLELPAGTGSSSEAANIVVRVPDAAVSLLVDQVGDVISISNEAFERTPETMRPSARDLMHGVFQLEDRLLLELNLAKVLRAAYS